MHKLFFDSALTPEGWFDDVAVGIEDGVIATVEPGAAADARRFAEWLDGIAVPGVANLHSHTFQRGFAGLTEYGGPGVDHFWTWREAMYRLSALLSPDDVEAIAALAFVEMLESGFTGVAEFHYLHHSPDGAPYADPGETSARIAAAAAATGIRLTLLPVFYAHGGFGAMPPSPGQRRFTSSLDLFARVMESAETAVSALPGARVGVAPHSLRAATLDEIVYLAAAFPNCPFHIHAAEQVAEVEDCLAALGARPVEALLDRVPVGPDWCLIHATHMTPNETGRLARSGAVAGLCPITESDLGDGIFSAVAFLEAGGTFGVGTDSNVLISLAGELRTLEYNQRLRDRARNRLAPQQGSTGRNLLRRAAVGGAQALGAPPPGMRPGGPADIVVLDNRALELHGKRGDDVLDTWIFAAPRPLVRTVFVAGKALVRDGRHIARAPIEAAFRQTIDRLGGAV